MDPHAGKIVLNGAPSQYGRWLRALDAAQPQVDGRTPSQLFDFAVRFAGLVRYYDRADRPDGDWVEFFLADPAMVLALVNAMDIAASDAAFIRLEKQTAGERAFEIKFALLREVFGAILELARQLDAWLRGLGLAPENGAIDRARRELDALINGDAGEALRRLKAFDEGAGRPGALGEAIGLDYSGFLPLWDLDCVRPDGSIYQGANGNRKINHALPSLSRLFYILLDAGGSFQAWARENLSGALDDGRCRPQIALYLAFVELFQKAQATINSLSTRYQRFYYDDVLRESRQPAVPDSVFLSFTLAEEEGVESTTVPKGTLYPAGQDAEGRDILYAADRDLLVTAAQIAQLRTVRVLTGPLLAEQPAGEIVEQRILTAEIVPDVGAPWPTFGEGTTGTTETAGTEPATLGFALASDYLLLTGGEREIEIVIHYTAASQEALGKRLAELAAAGFDPTQALREVLAGAFTLQVSTADGWFELEGYEAIVPDPWDAAPQLTLRLDLPASVPPIAPLQTDGPVPALPTVEAHLRQEPVLLTGLNGTAWIYPLSLLGVVDVEDFEIDARVTALPGLALANSDGEIDPASPFPLLGGVPVVGSYLEIRHTELFVKVPRSLEIGVRWFGLPPNDDGFRGWYRDYVIGLDGQPSPTVLLDNAKFLGRVSAQSPGAWTLENEGSPYVYLFRTQNDCADPVPTPDGALCNETRFDTLEVDATPDGEPPYYDPAASAIRLELTSPPYAFGNDLYAINVLNAVLQDLPDVPACEAKCAEECLPLQDAARGIAACLAGCADVPDDQYAACILPCVEKTQEMLLLTFIERFLGCLEACLLSEDHLADFRACLQTCMTLPGVRRAIGVKACVEQLRASLAGDLLRCVESCLAKNLRFLEALFWIEEAILSCQRSPTYKDCMTASLAECVARLEAAYDECVAQCMADCTAPPKDLKYPNDPWLPTAEAVTIDYTAGTTLTPGSDDVFHLLPFGGWRRAGDPGGATPLLPRFPAQGNLYLGFSGLLPAQRLNLLFQLTAAGGEAALPPVVWQCLSGDDWQPLTPTEILSDTTNGLANTGVVAFRLPAFDPLGHTILPGDAQWLRASVATSAERFPDTAGIYPHVLTATWQNDGGGTGEHLRKPLPAHTITSSVQDLAYIGAIDQPLESFGGRPAEDQRGLDVRLSERLRHKDRGILAWDYERLVLERFPTIWKVQALPARNIEKGDAPGDVLVVVVAGPESQQVQDPTAPLVPGELLYQIETYLQERISPFIDLRVVNPNYVRITVTASVIFADGEDPGTNIARLNGDLVQYLSPWFYDAARAAKEGRYAYEDEISELVQNRPYVAALAAISFQYDPPEWQERPEWYFLTSAAAHVIEVATSPCEAGSERSSQ